MNAVQEDRRLKRPVHKDHQDHRGDPVPVGKFTVVLGGTMYLTLADMGGYDLIVPFKEQLSESIVEYVGYEHIRHYPIPDFGGVPADWEQFIGQTISDLKAGKRILAFCAGGHGRTGTFLASLIAVLEPKIKDPIETARRRYCGHAVETVKQAEAVFALKGQPLPKKYLRSR